MRLLRSADHLSTSKWGGKGCGGYFVQVAIFQSVLILGTESLVVRKNALVDAVVPVDPG